MANVLQILRCIFLCLTTFVTALCALYFLPFYTPNYHPHHLQPPTPLEINSPRGFLVDTPSCRIPNLDPMDPSITGLVQKLGKLNCRGRHHTVTYVDRNVLRINRTCIKTELSSNFSHCRYQAVTKSRYSDFRFDYGRLSTEFHTDIEMKDEFVRVYCYSKSNRILATTFHGFTLPKKDVESRCDMNLKMHVQRQHPKEIFSVHMLGVDSVSRLNFIRQMPKTREFLLKELDAVEMLGYNKVADNTFPNLVPILTGKFIAELPWNSTMAKKTFDEYSFIWKNFSQAGYRTLFAEDAPKIATFHYLKKGFRHPPTDYYNRALLIAMEKSKDLWHSHHHCVGNRLETDLVLEYTTEFCRQFKDKPHFGFSFITRVTHNRLNFAGYVDDSYLTFLKTFQAEHLLSNTILIFFSDHGIRFGKIRQTYLGKAEERLPFFFIVFPKWFKTKYPKLYRNAQINSRQLTTPFDVHETLKDILLFDGKDRAADVTQRGISLFRQIPKSRTCSHASILPHWCMCMNQETLPPSSDLANRTAHELVRKINSLLDSPLCAKLTLKKIHRAEKSVYDMTNRTGKLDHRAEPVVIYQVTLETAPGGAMFEGSLRHEASSQKFTLAGDISRLNVYGHQSGCLSNARLKKFCFCKSYQGD